MPLTLAPSVARALRGRDASQLRGTAVCPPPVAPVPRASVRGAARVFCIAAGLEGTSDSGRDEAWEAAQRAAANIRRRNPATDWSPPKAEPPKKGATNEELNNRYVDGGLQRDKPLPLSLAYRFERLPQGDTVRTLALAGCAFQAALTRGAHARLDAYRRRQTMHHLGVAVLLGACGCQLLKRAGVGTATARCADADARGAVDVAGPGVGAHLQRLQRQRLCAVPQPAEKQLCSHLHAVPRSRRSEVLKHTPVDP